MILVVCITATVLGLVAVTTASAIRALASSDEHNSFEGALAAAEAGIDRTLSTINLAYNGIPKVVDYTTPAPCAVPPPTAAQVATPDAERTWILGQLLGLPAACRQSSGSGEYVAVRPSGRQAVYSLGWSPSSTAPRAERRLVKAEYLFAPFKPTNALLTQGGLDFSGSVAITSPDASTTADVHSNSSILGYNNSLNVEGAISASGALPGPCPAGVTGGCTSLADLQDVPVVSALALYLDSARNNVGIWFDLCPDGRVRTPSPTVNALPCTGADVGGTGYRGWEFTAGTSSTPPLWTLPRTAGGPFEGTYYVYEGDAKVGDNGNSSTLWPITVIAEAKRTGVVDAATCDKRGGNIEWKLFNLTPKLPGIQFLADANLTGDANANAGSGLFLAGDKVDLQTSSSVLTGAVVASNACAAQGPNTVQGITLNYDDSTESALKDVIRTTLWLEYPSA